jgi:hypothetical protein
MHVEHHRTFKLAFIIKGKVLCVLCSAIIEDDVRAPDDALAARLHKRLTRPGFLFLFIRHQ